MTDSCLAQAMVAAAFGGLFGGMIGGVKTTYAPNTFTSNKLALQYMGKTSFHYAMLTTTFMGVQCASEGITVQKGFHNALAGGVALGVVASLLRQDYKYGLAIGGVSAIAMAGLELAGGSIDSRGEKVTDRFKLTKST